MSDAPRRNRSVESHLEQDAEALSVVLEDTLRLAARVLAVDRCVAGLVNPRDGWMRSVVGVAPDEVRSYLGVCSFAMMQQEATVFPDAREVAALAPLPPIRAADGYRWLVVAPLVATNGMKRGGLAAMCRAPRAWSDGDAELLELLLVQVVAHVEHTRSLDELRRRAQHQAGVISTLSGVMKASTTIAIVATDLSGRVGLFSEGAEHMFGVSAREAIGRTATFLLADRDLAVRSEPDAPPRSDRLASLVAGVGPDAPVEKPRAMRRADGSMFPASVAVACITADSGEPAGYAFIARDVTEERAVERMKDEFVSMVSHELRTPLTSIRGALGLLLGEVMGPVTEPVLELLRIADDNSERLLKVVGDILDMQRLASGRLALSFAPIDMRVAVSKAIDLVQPLAAARAVTCSLRRRAPSGGTAEADFDRIVQVLVNLLSNAVRYSPPSSQVYVDVDDIPGGVSVAVEDEGSGIPDEFRARLFQKFARASHGEGAPEGTGLGLSIVKAIVGLHGGAVAFRPAPVRGSIFSFEIPLERSVPGSRRLP